MIRHSHQTAVVFVFFGFVFASHYAAFKRDVQEYINMGRTLPYSDEWAKELERLSAEYHVTRYEALIAQLRQRTEMIYAMQKGNLDDVLADIYSDQCHRMAFDLQNFTGLYGHFEAVSTDAAKLVLSHPWAEDGKIYSTRIWEHQKKLIGEVERILSRGLLTGDSYDNMAKQLEAAMKTGAFNANRLITTEAAYFQERARENTMDALGVEKRQVFATLDTKTCEKCGEKDLKLIGSKEVPVPPPFHVFCRCTHGPYYDDEFSRQFDKRAYRDPETGKTKTTDMMSYEEWKEKYLKNDGENKEKYSKTTGKNDIIKKTDLPLSNAKDFQQLSKYLKKKYDITIDSSVKKLNYSAVNHALQGVESVFKEYPELVQQIKTITTVDKGVMSCSGDKIKFNPRYFQDWEKLKDQCKKLSNKGWWPPNATPASVGAHEAGHAVEGLLINLNSYGYAWLRKSDWDNSTMAKDIVVRALKNIQKTEYGKGKGFEKLMRNLSSYAYDSKGECFAEAFADVYANGNGANPLSIEIKRLAYEKYKALKGE